MSVTCLKEALAPWIRITTWHTYHPADDERFHRALAAAFTHCGCPIPPDELRETLAQLLTEHHPDKHGPHWTAVCEKFVSLADTIGQFVKDTGGPR